MSEEENLKDDRLYFEDGQMSLLPSSEMEDELFSQEERQGIYTADRLKACQPDKFAWVCQLLADPEISYRRITKLTGCHRLTLKAVERLKPEFIDAGRKRLVSSLDHLAHRSAEIIAENLEIVPVKSTTDLQKLSIIKAVAIDKRELLSGNPTHRVERKAEGLEEAKLHFDKLPGGPGPVIDAEYEITSFSGNLPESKKAGEDLAND